MATTDFSPSLRVRIAESHQLIGSFVKIPGPSPIEILGGAGFDFVVIDQEHSVFDRAATDLALLACKASGTAGIVRIPSLDSGSILSALDGGAAGILAPHIDSIDRAKELVAACRYRGGNRGFSAMTRAGRYGEKAMWRHIDGADAAVAVIAMIEDLAALRNIDKIVAVEGLDAVFIGRGDLTVAFGATSREDHAIAQAVDTILDAAIKANKAVWMMVDGPNGMSDLVEKGVSSFIVSSDQGMLRNAANAIMSDVGLAKKGQQRSL